MCLYRRITRIVMCSNAAAQRPFRQAIYARLVMTRVRLARKVLTNTIAFSVKMEISLSMFNSP